MTVPEGRNGIGVDTVLRNIQQDAALAVSQQVAWGYEPDIPGPKKWMLEKLALSDRFRNHPVEARTLAAGNLYRHAVESGVAMGAWQGIVESLRHPGRDTSVVRANVVLAADPDPLKQLLLHTVGLIEKADRGEPLAKEDLAMLEARNLEFQNATNAFKEADEQLHAAVSGAVIDRYSYLLEKQKPGAGKPYRAILEAMGGEIEPLSEAPQAASAFIRQLPGARVRMPAPWKRRTAIVAGVATAAVSLSGTGIAAAKSPNAPGPAPKSQPIVASISDNASPSPVIPKPTKQEAQPPQIRTVSGTQAPSAPATPKTPENIPDPNSPVPPPVITINPSKVPLGNDPVVTRPAPPIVPDPLAHPRQQEVAPADRTSVATISGTASPENDVTVAGDSSSAGAASSGNVTVAESDSATPLSLAPQVATVPESANPDVPPQLPPANPSPVNPAELAAARNLAGFYGQHGTTVDVAHAMTIAAEANGNTPASNSALAQSVATVVQNMGLNAPGTKPNINGAVAIVQAEFPDQSVTGTTADQSTAAPSQISGSAPQPGSEQSASKPTTFQGIVASSLAADPSLTSAASSSGTSTSTMESIDNALAGAAADVTPPANQQAVVAAVNSSNNSSTPSPSGGPNNPGNSTSAPGSKAPSHASKPSSPEVAKTKGTTLRQWAVATLVGSNLPVTQNNITKLVCWFAPESALPGTAGDENSAPRNNPFGSDHVTADSTQYNSSYNVQNYPTAEEGLHETIRMLTLDHWTAVRANLEADGSIADFVNAVNKAYDWPGALHWNFDEYNSYANQYVNGSQQSPTLPTPGSQTAQPSAQPNPPSSRSGEQLANVSIPYSEYALTVPKGGHGHDVPYVNEVSDIHNGDACGPTSAYTIEEALLKNPQSFSALMNGLESTGAYNNEIASTPAFLDYIKNNLGLHEHTIRYERNGPLTDADMAQVRKALDEHKLIMVHTSNEVSLAQGGSTTGHYYVMYAYDDNGYYFANVGNRADSPPGGRAFPRSVVEANIDGAYVLWD